MIRKLFIATVLTAAMVAGASMLITASNPVNAVPVPESMQAPHIEAQVSIANDLSAQSTVSSIDPMIQLPPAAASTPTSRDIEVVGQIGGGTHAVAISGTLAYMGVGPRLVILRVDSASPTVVGQTEPLPGVIVSIAVVGNYAYAAASNWSVHYTDVNSSFHVINVANPAAPREIGFYDIQGETNGLAVADHYAYIVNQFGGLHILDVSNPISPTQAGFYDRPGYFHAFAVAVVGHYAYVATSGDSGLEIFDVSNPSTPSLAGSYPGGGHSLATANHYVYVAGGEGLSILDVSNPISPTQVGLYKSSAGIWAVAVAGHYAYLVYTDESVWTSGLYVIEILNPFNPSKVGEYYMGQLFGGIATAMAVGQYVYVAAGSSLHIIDVSNPSNPSQAKLYVAPGYTQGVVVVGNYAYYLAGAGSPPLHILDMSNPVSPTEIGSYDALGQGVSVVVTGNYAYLATTAGLYILDVSNPVSPTLVSYSWPPPPAVTTGVAVLGHYAYIANGLAGLSIFDISNPSDPILVGSYKTPDYAWHVAVRDNYIYLASGDGGLWILRCPACLLDVPRFSKPVCGTTNRVMPPLFGLAHSGDTVNLYLDGSFAMSTTLTGSTFAFTPTLSPGTHTFTTTATTPQGTSPASEALRLTVSPTLAYDPADVTLAYAALWGTVTEHPRDSSGCANPNGWRVWLRPGYTATLAVPVSYTQSAIVTITLGDQTRVIADSLGTLRLPLTAVFTPPISSGAFTITVTADEQTSAATGSVLIDPDGYVFDKNVWDSQGITQTLAGVTVTCEYSDTIANKWVRWQAWAYDSQVNPQVTSEDGSYSFFVPPGIYRITTHHPDYWTFTSPGIVVVDKPTHLNIPLLLTRWYYLPMFGAIPTRIQ
jgi:hypothetical protein